MKPSALWFLASFFFLLSGVWATAQKKETAFDAAATGNLELRGFNLGGFDVHGFAARFPIDEAIRFAVEEGANFLALDWAVNFANDGSMIPGGGKFHPPFADIETVIAKAKAQGLYVMLKPHVSMATSNENRHTGNTSTSVFRPSRFFIDWKAYLLNLSELADRSGVDAICIGTELAFLDRSNRARWLELIAAIRAAYPGELTYDALFSVVAEWNWVDDVVFWDALDFIGCSLYVQLDVRDDASIETIRKAWTDSSNGKIGSVTANLRKLSQRFGKQVMALESGYPSVAGGLRDLNQAPAKEKKVDYDLQARGLGAMLSILYAEKGAWLKGISLWDLTPVLLAPEELAGIWHTQTMSVFGKPAAEIVKNYYTLP